MMVRRFNETMGPSVLLLSVQNQLNKPRNNLLTLHLLDQTLGFIFYDRVYLPYTLKTRHLYILRTAQATSL